MKFLAVLTFIFSTNLFAQDHLSPEEQTVIVEQIAKFERRQLWVTGHEDVESYTEKITKDDLDNAVKENALAEEPLERTQISSLYQCYHSPKSCRLFVIYLSGSMYGGYGNSRVWVLLNPFTAKYQKISQIVYAE